MLKDLSYWLKKYVFRKKINFGLKIDFILFFYKVSLIFNC